MSKMDSPRKGLTAASELCPTALDVPTWSVIPEVVYTSYAYISILFITCSVMYGLSVADGGGELEDGLTLDHGLIENAIYYLEVSIHLWPDRQPHLTPSPHRIRLHKEKSL